MCRKIFMYLGVLWGVTGLSQVDYGTERERMVNTQLKSRDITHAKTLKAMSKVPRHKFVPHQLRKNAYIDNPLPIGEGQTISQPYMVAYMTQELKLGIDHKVLEIGTGSGYQAAVLAEIVDSVYTVEIVEKLGYTAMETLRELGYQNIKVRLGDGYHGWPEKAPFDRIMVTAGAESIPPNLLEQLSEDGIMIIPIGPHEGVRQLVRITKRRGKVKREELMPVLFVPFTRAEKE